MEKACKLIMQKYMMIFILIGGISVMDAFAGSDYIAASNDAFVAATLVMTLASLKCFAVGIGKR